MKHIIYADSLAWALIGRGEEVFITTTTIAWISARDLSSDLGQNWKMDMDGDGWIFFQISDFAKSGSARAGGAAAGGRKSWSKLEEKVEEPLEKNT